MLRFPQQQYRLLYVDPPWQYDMWSEKGEGKSPQQHYKCMSDDELMAMRDDLLFCTAPDAVIFMWAVWPKLMFAGKLMEHWGFKYKTGGAWLKKTKHGKDGFGTGYIVRSSCEPFLIGTHGNAEILNRATRNIIEDENLIVDTIREHSRKPDSVYGYIENLFPGAYLELFARQTKEGWDAWGNEVNKFEEAA